MVRLLNPATVVLATQVALLGFLPQHEAGAAIFRLEEATVDSIDAAFDSSELTSQELVQLYLDRINAYDGSGPTINSIITINPNALETAAQLDQERQSKGPRSPLHGIPVILKDNYDTFDLPNTGGSVTLKGSIPSDEAFTVKQFRDAGAIILGKANMSEFALSSGRLGYSSLGGLTLNPYQLNRDASGSSSGTAAAIAANFGVIGTGSDTAGSIRAPSAVTNIVGIKPTLGLTSRDGIIPLALSLDVGGPMARTVTDAAIALGVMTGVDPNDSRTLESEGKFYKDYTPFLQANALDGARIGVAQDFFGGNPDVDQSVNSAVTKMAELGATIVDPLKLPEKVLAASDYANLMDPVVTTEFKPQIEDYFATLAEGYPKTLAELIAASESPEVVNSDTPVNPARIEEYERSEASGGLTNPAYLKAKGEILSLRDEILSIMDANNLDAIVYPTIGCPASPIFTTEDPTYVCNVEDPYQGEYLANLTGFPDITIPAGFTKDRLPVGVSFFGRAYSEPDLLGFAYAYEQATLNRRPSSLVPPLPGEPVPEPGTTAATVLIGLGALSLKLKQRHKPQSNKSSAKHVGLTQLLK